MVATAQRRRQEDDYDYVELDDEPTPGRGFSLVSLLPCKHKIRGGVALPLFLALSKANFSTTASGPGRDVAG